jgi:replication factor A1
MTLEERIKKISEVSNVSEDEIRARIEKKKEDAAGLLTDHGAVYALEKEYGIDNNSQTKTEFTEISKLSPQLNNVNVLGVVKAIRPVKTFSTPKRTGKLSRITLIDHSGEGNVVLWDKNAEIVESDKLKPGSRVLIRNAYTREGLDKQAELHVGGLTRFILEPKNIDPKLLDKLPKIEEKIAKIAELLENQDASVHGQIIYSYPKSEFERKDGSTGQRSSMIIGDDSGKVRIVLWDSSADKIEEFKEGEVIKIEGGQVRNGTRGTEIHIGTRGRILPSTANINVAEEKSMTSPAKTYNLSEIEPNLSNVNVLGRVIRVLPIKEFSSAERSGKLASIILADDSGFSRAVLWNEMADKTLDINQGDAVLIRNAYTKQGLSGETELHVSNRGGLDINPTDKELPKMALLLEKHASDKEIGSLGPEDRNVKVSAKIIEVEEAPAVFEVCSECGSRIENIAGEWLCDNCGEAKPSYGMVVSCTLEDKTGSVRAVFYRELAEQLTGMSVADVLNLIGQSGSEIEPCRHIQNELSGSNISIIGNTRYNDFFDRLELMVSAISSQDKSVKSVPQTSPLEKEPLETEDLPKEALEDPEEFEIEELDLDD